MSEDQEREWRLELEQKWNDAELEIKGLQAELLKAQIRRENAEASLVEKDVANRP